MRYRNSTPGTRRRRQRHGTIVAYLALFVALGGTAFAAAGIAARDSVVSKSIKDGTVKSADVRDGGLTGADIEESSLGRVPSAVAAQRSQAASTADRAALADLAGQAETAKQAEIAKEAAVAERAGSAERANLALGVAENAIGGPEIANSAIRTEDIDAGAVGSWQLRSVVTAVSEGTTISAGTPGDARVHCPNSRRILAAGFAWRDDEPNSIVHSAPSEASPATSWVVRGLVPSGSNVLYAWATCLNF